MQVRPSADLAAPTYSILKAFVHESYRWRPVSSGGFVHRADEDIVYVRPNVILSAY